MREYFFFCILQEYSVQITFRQQWNDNRLAFDDKGGKYNSHYVLNTYLLVSIRVKPNFNIFVIGRIKYLTMVDSRRVWMPDTFFRNEKQGQFHNIIQPNLYIRVFPNGDILYSIRYKKSLKKCHFVNISCDFFFSFQSVLNIVMSNDSGALSLRHSSLFS